jgi:cholesterol oxidase
MSRLSKPATSLAAEYDAVVVGSGYGGAIAASRLARMSHRDGRKLAVALLERGREIPVGEYPNSPPRAAAEFQIHHAEGHVGDRRGLFSLHRNDDVNVLVGCGLGGTSLINANVAAEPTREVLDDPVWPAALRADRAGFAEGIARARAMLRPTPYPGHERLEKLEALRQAAAATGGKFVEPPIAVTFEDTANPQGGCKRPARCAAIAAPAATSALRTPR